jgi:hypothetical protein
VDATKIANLRSLAYFKDNLNLPLQVGFSFHLFLVLFRTFASLAGLAVAQRLLLLRRGPWN